MKRLQCSFFHFITSRVRHVTITGLRKLRNHEDLVTTNDITFVSSFVTMDPLVQKLEGVSQDADLLSLLLKKRKRYK